MGTMMGSRRATRTLALICVLALASPARWASAATVAEIAKNPAAFDQKTVTVTGTATQVSSSRRFPAGPSTMNSRRPQSQPGCSNDNRGKVVIRSLMKP